MWFCVCLFIRYGRQFYYGFAQGVEGTFQSNSNYAVTDCAIFYYKTNSKELYVIKTDSQINRFRPIKQYLHTLSIW